MNLIRFVTFRYVVLIVVGTCVMSHSAWAVTAAYNMAVIPLKKESGFNEEEANLLREIVRTELAKTSMIHVPTSAYVDNLLILTDTSCRSDECLKQTATMLKTNFIVSGSVSHTVDVSTEKWNVSLWIFDKHVSTRIATVSDSCTACSSNDVRNLVAALVPTLLKRMSEYTPPVLGATTSNSSAIDDPDASPSKEHKSPNSDSSRSRWLPWTLAATSVGAIGAGVAMMLLGKGSSTNNRGEQLQQVTDWTLPGIVLLATGGALGVTSGLLFWVSAGSTESNASHRAHAQPYLGKHTLLRVSGTF